MNPILILLKRDLLELKKSILVVLIFWFLMPLLIHIFLSIPLSNLIRVDIRYMSWSAPGIWITCSCMVAFLQSSERMRKLKSNSFQMEAILKAPISNFNLLTANTLRGMSYGLVQFFISIIITSILNHDNYSLLTLLTISIQMFFLIFHFATIGTFVGSSISNNNIFYSIIYFLFLCLAIGFGNFIPLKYYPESFLSIINLIPTVSSFENIRSIILQNIFNWTSFILTLLLSVFLSALNLIFSHKTFRRV